MALSNNDIINYITQKKLIITPFEQKILTGNGVDLRLGTKIARLISLGSNNDIFDSKKEENLERWYRIETVDDYFVIYPHESILCHTLEYLKLPDDLIGLCQLRSTYARIGLSMPPTVIDAGFEGQLTIELIGTNFPVRIYVKERMIHITFFKLITPSTSPYMGKYQGQKGVTLPNLKEKDE
jgi:dCTP deaminase